ncbi:MAG: tetratricopeptide repeat protein [Halieaceae bacterium]|nr:tetratricopeptide repeat protein [Halieaceae bacterium]
MSSNLLKELQRRNVYKVALAYIVVGWVVMQVAEFLSPLLQLPDWTVSLALYLGILGFPFALIFAWAFELTPEGLRLTESVQREESITAETGKSLNRSIIALMAVAIVLLLGERFYSASQPDDTTAGSDIVSQTDGKEGSSIAVLPFVNMSKDPDQEYFSDGISEELLNGLAKIRELRVAARTSSFAFKGKNTDITDIGRQLNVGTVLEGSVRKSGNRVRITAQLINVEDGYHLWSEVYDRELTDIFTIQDEISRAIVDALKVHLTDEELAATAPTQATQPANVEAYNFYLLAKHNLRLRNETALKLAIRQYTRALDSDPGYAQAYAGQALATHLLSTAQYGDIPLQTANREAQALLDRAFALDPNLPEAHAIQGLLLSDELDYDGAERSLRRAIEGNPSEGIVYNWLHTVVGGKGDYNESQRILEQAFAIDPLHPAIRNNLATSIAERGNVARARELVTPGTAQAYMVEAYIEALDGNFANMRESFEEAIAVSERGGMTRSSTVIGFYSFFNLGDAREEFEAMPDHVQRALMAMREPNRGQEYLAEIPAEEQDDWYIYGMAWLYLLNGDAPQALHTLDRAFDPSAPIYGNAGRAFAPLDFASIYAYTLMQLGREDEARALAQRALDFVALAKSNGEPPGSVSRYEAEAYAVLGNEAGVVGAMKEGWSHYNISWIDFESPMLLSVADNAELAALRTAVLAHVNAERQKLGWEPLQVTRL